MRLDDIPPGRMRAQVIEALARDEAARRRVRSENPAPTTATATRDPLPPGGPRRRSTYRCGGRRGCGAPSDTWAAAQRHADEHGGARIEVEL